LRKWRWEESINIIKRSPCSEVMGIQFEARMTCENEQKIRDSTTKLMSKTMEEMDNEEQLPSSGWER
jgi:hypothetical protein